MCTMTKQKGNSNIQGQFKKYKPFALEFSKYERKYELYQTRSEMKNQKQRK